MIVKSLQNEEGTISIEEAKREVKIATQRIGLLHLSFARTLVDEFGEEKGKQLILKAIKDYGNRIGERKRKALADKGLDPTPENSPKVADLPKFGINEGSEVIEVEGEKRIRSYGCAIAKVWEEYGEEKLGRFYCYVDVAKYMAFNPDYKMVHEKALPDGDDCCEFVVKPTSDKEKEDFLDDDKEWSYIDG